jgi:hypothetical protein
LITAILALALLSGTPVADGEGDATWYGWGGSCVDGYLRTCSPYLSGERKLYAAVGSWRWGDKPYAVKVCAIKNGKCVIAIVRDFCRACKNGFGIIDLSPRLFRQLYPLGIGRIDVSVERYYTPSNRTPVAR